MYERFAMLLKERGLKMSDVAKGTGIAPGTLSEWKSGKYNLKTEKLAKIADYFGVPIDFFIKADFPEIEKYLKWPEEPIDGISPASWAEYLHDERSTEEPPEEYYEDLRRSYEESSLDEEDEEDRELLIKSLVRNAEQANISDLNMVASMLRRMNRYNKALRKNNLDNHKRKRKVVVAK